MESTSITIPIAFVAGLLSFLSPCVLPLVPGYISLMSGVSIDRLKDGNAGGNARRAVIVNSLAFNAGLSAIFVALGTTAGLVGASIISNPWVRIIGGLVIIAFGLQLIGLLKISTLYKDTRFFSNDKPRGPLGSFTLGIAFAAGWTPCIGPILGGILGLAAASGGWRSGLLLSTFYSMGLAVPFLLTGLGLNQFLAFYGKFRRHLHKVEVISGIVLIVVGALVMSGKSTLLTSGRVAAMIPNLENLIKIKGTPPPAVTVNQKFQAAPDVELQTLAGQPFRLNELKGRVVLVNFWATWCIPCRAEIPEFNAMQRELKAKGLEVVGISTSPGDTADVIRDFQEDLKQEYTVLRGAEDIGDKFGNGPGLPISYVIDRDGLIRQRIIGARDRAGWEAVVKPLLDEARTTTQQTGQTRVEPKSPEEAPMEELLAAPPDILKQEHCDIAENVTYRPEEGGRAPLRVTFDASAARAPCGRIKSWVWDFGDGASGSGSRVTHIYRKTGSFAAKVNISDSQGFTNLVEIEYIVYVTGANT